MTKQEYDREYRQAHRSERMATQQTWRASHRDERTAMDRAYHRANPERQAYRSAKQRCTNPRNPKWSSYGRRGIRFLFESFDQFIHELGPRPVGLTLDRIDNDGHYEPGNVRWTDRSTQNRNRRTLVPPSSGRKSYYA